MIEEIPSGARRDGFLARRWYSSAHFDLYVWRQTTHEIVQFQLFWIRPASLQDADHIPEEAITWQRDVGFQHAQVSEAGRYRAPILHDHTDIDLAGLITAFEQDAVPSNYPDVLFVREKLLAICA